MKIRLGDESIDSGSESQPLMSSGNSQTSLVATHCIFPDSETSDFDQTLSRTIADSIKQSKPLYGGTDNAIPSYFSNQNRQYTKDSFPKRTITNGLSKSNQYEKFTENKFQYYSKLRSSLPICESPPMEKEIINISCRSTFNESHAGKQGSLVTIFSIWNTIIGTSLLTMSWCLEKSGLIPGIMLILIISGICLYTAFTTLKVSRDHGMPGKACEVPEMCRLLVGVWAEYLAKLFSIIVLLGATAVYWVLMSNFFYHSVNVLHDIIVGSNHSVDNRTVVCPKYENISYPLTAPHGSIGTDFEKIWDLYTTVPIFLALVMFPLLNFKSPTFFTKFNSFGTVSLVYLFVFVGIKSFDWGVNMPKNWFQMELHLKPNFTILTGVLALSYFIHNIVITLMQNNRHQENNGRDLTIAYGLCTVTYLFIGVLFYVTFPLDKSCIEDNILNNFVKWDLATILARMLLMFQLVTVCPLITFMLRQNVLVLLVTPVMHYNAQRIMFPFKYVVIFNVIITIIGILIASFLPRIGTIIRYTGAISGFVLIFTLPSLLQLSSLRKQHKLTLLKVIFLLSIIVIGLLNLIAQFFVVE